MVKNQNEIKAETKAVVAAEKLLEQRGDGGASKVEPEKSVEYNPSNPAVQNNVPAVTNSEAKGEQDGAKEPQPGDKRVHDAAVTPVGEDQATDAPAEAFSKKQKTDDEKSAPGDANPESETTKEETSAPPATNGEKKRPGRPPKKGVKDIVKKLTPRSTEGIGSRTRSRVKLTE